ncbi:hypothetical protein [Pantoea sp. USHLN298]|uniref:hypothetical protein n=1 Tax=Pantoea sp. USHLN298 TaxID=3081294 RepID=UPI003019B1AD
MQNRVNINSAQLAKLIMGKSLTEAEMHHLVREHYPDYAVNSVRTSLKTLIRSPYCLIEIGTDSPKRTYFLKGVDKKFFILSERSTDRESVSARHHFNQDEKSFIERMKNFDQLIKAVRSG